MRLPPVAPNYRASGLVPWHISDIAGQLDNVP
jgi:hypothetical protein